MPDEKHDDAVLEFEVDQSDEDDSPRSDGLSGVPDAIRRVAALGLSGFFSTESALRKALGDTLPKDWVDFAAEQGDRTRDELLDRITAEFGRVIENLEFADLMAQLLEGRTVEIETKIRLGPKTTQPGSPDTPPPNPQAKRRRPSDGDE